MNMFTFLAPVYDIILFRMHNRHKDVLLETIPSPAGKKVLDVGGGTGRLAKELSDAGAQVWVLDASEAMLRQARRILPAEQVVYGKAEELPFADDSFDCITIVDALHHIRLQDETMREALRALKPGGTLYLLEFTPQTLFGIFLRLLERLAGEPALFLTPQELEKMLTDAGFETSQSKHLTKHEYLTQGAKPTTD